MPFSLIIFDLDGTLVDTSEDLTTAVNLTLTELGRDPLSLAEVCTYVGDGARTLVEKFLPGADASRLDAALVRFGEHYRAHLLDRTRPYPGVEEWLQSLAGLPKALASNKPIGFITPLLSHLGWDAQFAPVLGGDSLPQKKPDPEVVWAACRHHGVEPSATLVVGDGVQDIAAARAAGAKSCAVTWGFRSRELLQESGPDWIIDAPRQLLQLLEPS